MSNWNKVNSEMHSLTDGPYHCIVCESGQMYYCEVFRDDDLILASTVEGLQEAKNTCEIEILADLQKMGLFNARIAEQSIFGKQSLLVVFDFKDTGDKEEIIKQHAQADKAVEDGCKAATEQEPQPRWLSTSGKVCHLHIGKFYMYLYPALGKWCLLIQDLDSGDFVLNELTDGPMAASKMAEEFLKGYYEGPEAKLDEARKNQPNPTEVEETVIAQIRKRRDVGREKYGTTMEREDLSFLEWLQHLQEELLDAAIYAEKLKREHRKELLSDMIADDENSGLYEA